MKDIVFISHSFPQDNYAANWLAAKLKVLGYNAWVDVDDLSAGDAFNTVIGPVIKNKAKVFLAVTTKSYAAKAQNPNSGVSRELNASDTVDLVELGHNFLLPVRFDDIPYGDFPYHYQGKNAIEFGHNWQQGLIAVVTQLDRLGVPKLDQPEDPFNLWYTSLSVQGKPLKKTEGYFSNWFPFNPPETIYIHTPKAFRKEDLFDQPFPFILEANRIISFAGSDTIGKWTPLTSSVTIPMQKFYENDDLPVTEDFILKEPKKKLIKLLNTSFERHLFKCGLVGWRRAATQRRIFYFRSDRVPKSIPLKRYGKPKGRRALCGTVSALINEKSKKVNWAFSLGFQAHLEPVPHFKVFSSAVFTDEHYKRFDIQVHHQLRRSVCSTWYNREWYEKLLAAMLAVSPATDAQWIAIDIDGDKYIELDNEPLNGVASMGYLEPNNPDDN